MPSSAIAKPILNSASNSSQQNAKSSVKIKSGETAIIDFGAASTGSTHTRLLEFDTFNGSTNPGYIDSGGVTMMRITCPEVAATPKDLSDILTQAYGIKFLRYAPSLKASHSSQSTLLVPFANSGVGKIVLSYHPVSCGSVECNFSVEGVNGTVIFQFQVRANVIAAKENVAPKTSGNFIAMTLRYICLIVGVL